MGNAIIIGILLVIGFLAIRSSAKHFKGEGGCCGGGGSVPKQKKVIKNALYHKELLLDGMHCENCKNSVEKAINAIDGAAAKVDLKKQTARVDLEHEVSDQVLTEAVVKAGYQVKSVRNI